jgi:tRNA pseudouridine32 synthase/23S rRNA pseudouridine746 synthase
MRPDLNLQPMFDHPASSPHTLHVVYEDAQLLVLDKPPGLLSVPGRGPDKQDCLSARAMARYPDALIVHRLDMSTSGLVLMARGAVMQRALSIAFAARDVEKRYEAVVDGTPISTDGAGGWNEIDAPIAADWPRRPLRVIDAAGQPSLTRWRLAKPLPERGASLLALEPFTGRTHQLRVHLASIGHAILGDMLYGDNGTQQRAERLMLHATELALLHPVSGEPLRFASASGF